MNQTTHPKFSNFSPNSMLNLYESIPKPDAALHLVERCVKTGDGFWPASVFAHLHESLGFSAKHSTLRSRSE